MLYVYYIKIFQEVYLKLLVFNDIYWLCLLVFQENGEFIKWRIENSCGDFDGDKGKDKFIKFII